MPVTDEDAAIEAIEFLASPSKEQDDARSQIKTLLVSDDPFIDIHELFKLYNTLYFRSLLLPRVEVSWSPRLTLCAGICELVRGPSNGNKYTRIRLKLSEPLLKFRPRSDVINTLLHEAIHAYFFITTSWRHSRGDDGTGHGAGFLLLADAINSHGDYEVTVYHTFHDEVDSYRKHIWKCDGRCTAIPPFFGLVKRSMNRAPGKSDLWWQKHQDECGGTFTKIAEPELSKAQIEKLSGLQRAGRQKNKIDAWVSGSSKDKSDLTLGHSFEHGSQAVGKRLQREAACPICGLTLELEKVNAHLDSVH